MNTETLRKIIDAIRHCPSADNMQPWKFRILNNQSFEILYDKSEAVVTPLYNVGYFADYTSLGMLLKNIEIVAHEYQASPIVQIEETEKLWKATIQLQAQGKNLNEDLNKQFKALFKRHTDRRAYRTSPIQTEALRRLKNIAEKHGARLFLKGGKSLKSRYARTLTLGDTLLWTNPHMRNNLIRMLRLSPGEHTDGLALDSLGMETRIEQFLLKQSILFAQRFPWAWNLVAATSKINTRKIINNSGALCLLTIPNLPRNSMQAYIEGGKIFQELWLETEMQGIALQPMFAIIGLLLNEEEKLGGLTPEEIPLRDQLTHFFRTEFPKTETSTVIAFFRIGNPRPKSIHPASKQPVESLLITD